MEDQTIQCFHISPIQGESVIHILDYRNVYLILDELFHEKSSDFAAVNTNCFKLIQRIKRKGGFLNSNRKDE